MYDYLSLLISVNKTDIHSDRRRKFVEQFNDSVGLRWHVDMGLRKTKF